MVFSKNNYSELWTEGMLVTGHFMSGCARYTTVILAHDTEQGNVTCLCERNCSITGNIRDTVVYLDGNFEFNYLRAICNFNKGI